MILNKRRLELKLVNEFRVQELDFTKFVYESLWTDNKPTENENSDDIDFWIEQISPLNGYCGRWLYIAFDAVVRFTLNSKLSEEKLLSSWSPNLEGLNSEFANRVKALPFFSKFSSLFETENLEEHFLSITENSSDFRKLFKEILQNVSPEDRERIEMSLIRNLFASVFGQSNFSMIGGWYKLNHNSKLLSEHIEKVFQEDFYCLLMTRPAKDLVLLLRKKTTQLHCQHNVLLAKYEKLKNKSEVYLDLKSRFVVNC